MTKPANFSQFGRTCTECDLKRSFMGDGGF